MAVTPNAGERNYSIVLVGSFNPAILNPDWLAAHGLIRPEEASGDGVEVTIVSADVAVFRAVWLRLQATRDKIIFSTSDEEHRESLRELVEGVFRLLEYTPIKLMGLNTSQRFVIQSEDDWNDLGDRLAPKDPWTDVVKGMRENGDPGLLSLTIQGIRDDSSSKFVTFTVRGVAERVLEISSNEHFEAEVDQGPDELMQALHTSWIGSLVYAEQVANHILAGVGKE